MYLIVVYVGSCGGPFHEVSGVYVIANGNAGCTEAIDTLWGLLIHASVSGRQP